MLLRQRGTAERGGGVGAAACAGMLGILSAETPTCKGCKCHAALCSQPSNSSRSVAIHMQARLQQEDRAHPQTRSETQTCINKEQLNTHTQTHRSLGKQPIVFNQQTGLSFAL